MKVVVTTQDHKDLDEESVCRNAFEIMLAFDDVASNGWRDSVEVSQITR